MAKKQEKSQAQATEIKDGLKIRAVGPTDIYNGAQVLRYKSNEPTKQAIDIQAGMILEVGSDITKDEADRFLSLQNWSFERVEG